MGRWGWIVRKLPWQRMYVQRKDAYFLKNSISISNAGDLSDK
jgi:hypothetical protein